MRNDLHNKGVQTLVSVTPHYLKPSDAPDKVRVRCNRSVQTETHLSASESFEIVQQALTYTPYVYILHDALKIYEIPKKCTLKFNDKITEEDIDNFDERSTWDPSELAQILSGSFCGKSSLRPIMDSPPKRVDEECQTTLMVRPIFLALDDVAQVVCNLQVQTSRTFTPNASMEQVNRDLHAYYFHQPGSGFFSDRKSKSEYEETVIGYFEDQAEGECTERQSCTNSCREEAEEQAESAGEHEREHEEDGEEEHEEEHEEEYEEGRDEEYDEERGEEYEEGHEEEVATTPKRTSKSPVKVPSSQQAPRSERSQSQHEPAHYTAEDLKAACNTCCTEADLLEHIKPWYDEVENLLEEEDYEENIDPITGENLEEIEAQIIAQVDMTAETVQKQAQRMCKRYSTQDFEIQCKEFADHKVPGECTGARQRDKSCTCDCQLNVPPEPRSAGTGAGANICAMKLAELCKMIMGGTYNGAFAGRLGEITSSPALVHCPCGDPPSRSAKTELPLKARACTNRKCNCLNSKGCLPCQKALCMKDKEDSKNPYKSCKKFIASQNIEFITEIDGEYTDVHLEPLEQDDAFTQTEVIDEYFGERNAPIIPPPPCTCMTNIEMPWDLLCIPPTPKKRPPPVEEFKALPNAVRIQLLELTTRPLAALDNLLPLSMQFLESQYGTTDDYEEIQRQLLIITTQLELAEDSECEEERDEESNESGEEEEEEKDKYHSCRPRAPLKPFQVYDPECEEYYEPYLVRLVRYYCEDDMAGPCTSHVEMPWHEIELPKNVVIRKGRAPCERKRELFTDQGRICGPEYRAQMRRQREMNELYGIKDDNLCGIETCKVKSARKGASNPDIKKSMDTNVCKPCSSFSQPDISSKRSSVTSNASTFGQDNTSSGKIISCLKRKGSKGRSSSSCKCPRGVKSTTSGMGKSTESRTERIAALLDSCKKEMEPIKNGINRLRARIKELNIPDLRAYQEPSQQQFGSGLNAATSANLSFLSSMGGLGMPPMPPMCYPPPMMCYPFPPCMYPPGGPNAQVSRGPPSLGVQGKCTSRRRRRLSSGPSTTDTGSPSSDFEDLLRSKRRSSKGSSSVSRSRSRLLCSCKPQDSKVQSSSSRHSSRHSSQQSKASEMAQKGTTVDSSLVNSSFYICPATTASTTSKMTNRSKQSRIPRPICPARLQSSGNVVPCSSLKPSQMTERSSTFKSCASNFAAKSLKSCLSEKSDASFKSVKSCRSRVSEATTIKSCKKGTSAGDTGKADPSKTSICAHCSVVMVESAATQKSNCDLTTCPTSFASSSAVGKPSILKTNFKSVPSPSCKIRFDDTQNSESSKCKSKKHQSEKVEAGAEVKRGRSVGGSSGEDICTASCSKRKSRDA